MNETVLKKLEQIASASHLTLKFKIILNTVAETLKPLPWEMRDEAFSKWLNGLQKPAMRERILHGWLNLFGQQKIKVHM